MADAKAAESGGPPNPNWPLKDKEGFVTVTAERVLYRQPTGPNPLYHRDD